MCYSLGGSRGPPVVLALLCFALCLTFFFLGQEFLRRPGEGTRTGVLSVCLGALGRPCWLSPRSDCGLVAPCPQASHPAGPDPRRSGFPSCVTRFFGSWRRVAAVFVLLFVKILLDIHQKYWLIGEKITVEKKRKLLKMILHYSREKGIIQNIPYV